MPSLRRAAKGNVSQVSDAALLAALASQGIGAERQDLTIDLPQTLGAPPTTGYSNDPVNTSTGNFLETEVDLGFAGAASSLSAARTYNSMDERVGVFGPGWASVFETRLDSTTRALPSSWPTGAMCGSRGSVPDGTAQPAKASG